MLHAVTLSLALVLSSAPADLGPAPEVAEPAPVQCADAKLAQATAPLFAALGDISALSVTCRVDCDGNGTEETSCTGATCTAVQRNCSTGQRGYVECDEHRTNCPACACNEGDIRIVATGACCDCYDAGGAEHDFEKCVNGEWVWQRTTCFGTGMCPICQ